MTNFLDIFKMDLPTACAVILQQRDDLVRRAISRSDWETVLEIIRTGVTKETLNFAFWASVMECKSEFTKELAKLDRSPEKVNFALQDAIIKSRWDYIAELLLVGVGQDNEVQTLTEAMRLDLWQIVPHLFTHCFSPRSRNVVLREAIRRLQWPCVLLIVKLGILNEGQKHYVCNEALPWGHWDCVAELLRQGICEHYSRRIVNEALRWNDWHFVADMVVYSACERLQATLLLTFIIHKRLDAFKYMLVHLENVSDKHLMLLMRAATRNNGDDFLCSLVTCLRKGRRVFEHFCASESIDSTFAFILYNRLRIEGDLGLALRVATTQGMWEWVIELFDDCRLTKQARRSALLQAVKKEKWEQVLQMVGRMPRSKQSRRLTFLEAVRRNKFVWALKLFGKRVVQEGDLEFAVHMCTSARSWDYALDLCHLAHKRLTCSRLLSHIIQECVKDYRPALVVERCINSACKWKCCKDVFTKVLGHISSLNVHSYEIFQWTSFLSETPFLAKCMKWRSVCVPILEKMIESDYCNLESVKRSLKEIESLDLSALAQWCIKHSFPKSAIFVYMIRKEWNAVTEMMEQVHGSLSKNVLNFGLERAMKQEQWETGVLFLQSLPTTSLNYKVIDYIFEEDVSPLFEVLHLKGMHDWILEIALTTSKLDVVEREIARLEIDKISDDLVDRIIDCDGWNIISNLLDRFSGCDLDLAAILRCAVNSGEVKCTEKLLRIIDPLSATDDDATILQAAVSSASNREEIVRLCVISGMSTYQCCMEDDYYDDEEEDDDDDEAESIYWSSYVSPMKTALFNGQMPLVKLLYASGACTNRELHRLKRSSKLRSQLEVQGRKDILQYLDMAATIPRSLQNLSCLFVSHVIGCHPGRSERVSSLPVPEMVKNFILFKDLL